MLVRRCVACGYDGGLLNAGLAERCARCGVDLRERPAMSYAEMEGLLGQPLEVRDIAGGSNTSQLDRRPHYQQSIIQRWLAFLFLAMVGLVAFVYLAAAAVPA